MLQGFELLKNCKRKYVFFKAILIFLTEVLKHAEISIFSNNEIQLFLSSSLSAVGVEEIKVYTFFCQNKKNNHYYLDFKL